MMNEMENQQIGLSQTEAQTPSVADFGGHISSNIQTETETKQMSGTTGKIFDLSTMTEKELKELLAKTQGQLKQREDGRNKALAEIRSLCEKHDITLSDLRPLFKK